MNLCKCKGSSGDVHLECLKSYLDSKKIDHKSTPRIQTFFWKRFECEICRQSYPLSVNIDGEEIALTTY